MYAEAEAGSQPLYVTTVAWEDQMITYSEAADALYVQLQEAEVRRTSPVDDSRIVDYAEDRSVIGVEFLHASTGLDLSDLPERGRLEAEVKVLTFPALA